jgi:Cu(I)/Ag(I) efflux system membrane fusion protein
MRTSRYIFQFVFLFLMLLGVSGCDNRNKNKSSEMKDMDMSKDSDYYTCSMHPTVKSKEPGNCPICKMKLIKVKAAKIKLAPNQLMIDEYKQSLAGISTSVAIISEINPVITTTGKAAVDENKTVSISSRMNGRIDKLYLRNPDEYVNTGQPLYDLYSEELLADENDYLLSLEQESKTITNKETFSNITQASKNKLVLWGMTDSQIKELENKKNLSSKITIHSQVSGFVTDILVKEGQYVSEGTVVFKITDLSSVWVEAQLYPDEIQYLNKTKQIPIEFEALPNEMFNGQEVFDNPSFENNTKINLVRFIVENLTNKIKPGMMAYIRLQKDHKKTLVVPKSAVLAGVMTTMWVEIAKNIFENRMIETGLEDRKNVEIISGIKEGEKVVISGAYLINSEYIFKKGVDPMAGMKM